MVYTKADGSVEEIAGNDVVMMATGEGRVMSVLLACTVNPHRPTPSLRHLPFTVPLCPTPSLISHYPMPYRL